MPERTILRYYFLCMGDPRQSAAALPRTHNALRVCMFTDATIAENGYLFWREGDTDAWAVDPGFDPQVEQMIATLAAHGLQLRGILITHGHFDHIAGVDALRQAAGGEVELIAPAGEAELLADPWQNLSQFFGTPITCASATRLAQPEDALTLSGQTWHCLDVSGHSPAALAFRQADSRVAFVGDAVMADSIGRYDFPHSNRRRLLHNIRDQLLSLPPETTLYSGHGPPATVARIQRENMVLAMELQKL